jgi:peptide deformylase
MINDVWVVNEEKERKVLRRKAVDVDFKKFTKKEVTDLISRMRRIMRAANGIGLSANQIGLPFNMFVAEVPDVDKGGTKFYAIFNPIIEKKSKATAVLEEGCLSIPGVWGYVPRAEEVTLTGFDRNGKPLKIKAWGLLAHVFQHETDHLQGKLFTDRTKEIFKHEKE